jgi:glycosyltransferase involved in cell wall biosynthesis
VRFSVYIPVWNGARWLDGAIESLLAQTYQDWELVIGDNASTDGTGEIATRRTDPRIRYHRWEDFSEISENYNRTLHLCQGDWLQLLGVDDRLDPLCLEHMADRIDKAAAAGRPLALVVTTCRRVDEEGRPADREYYRHGRIGTFRNGIYSGAEWLAAVAAPAALPWNSGSVAISHEVMDKIGSLFRPETGVCADIELYLRVAAYGDVGYIDEPLLDFMVHGSSDGVARVRRNLENGDPFGPLGIAFAAGLAIHEMRRDVTDAERRAVRGAIARELLGRALLHRYHPGGRGRRGAVRDVARAAGWSARTALQPRQIAKAAAAILAPGRVLQWGRASLENERRDSQAAGLRP